MVLLLGEKPGGLPNKVVLGVMKYLMKVLHVFFYIITYIKGWDLWSDQSNLKNQI